MAYLRAYLLIRDGKPATFQITRQHRQSLRHNLKLQGKQTHVVEIQPDQIIQLRSGRLDLTPLGKDFVTDYGRKAMQAGMNV